MTDGLKDQHREAVIAAIAANDRVERAVLFGSRANGTNTVSSDVDIALFGDRLTLTDQARLAAALDEIPMAQEIDLVLYDSTKDQTLREQIQRHGIEWYARMGSVSASRNTWPAHAGAASGESEWRESTWGEEITLEYGKALRGYDASEGPFRVFGSNGPIGWTDKALSIGPGVILGRKGAYRGVQYSTDPFFVIDTAYHVVSKSQQHDMRWLFYAIKYYRLGEIDDGSPIPSTTRAAVYPRELIVPPRAEQRAIGHVLGTLEDKVDLNRRMNATLEAMAQALFKSWFVDFDPVRAKMQGRDTGLPKDISDLFPDALDDDKPVGWKTFTLAHVAHHHRASVSPSDQPERTFEHYSIPAYDAGSEPTLDSGGSIKSNKTVVPEGAVLLSKLNPEIARVWLPNPKGELPQVASTEFLVFTPLAAATRSVLFLMFKSEAFRAEMVAMVTGTSKSHQRVPPRALLTLHVLTADPRIITAFDDMVRPLFDRLLVNDHEALTLSQTCNLLLPRLVSGEFRFTEAKMWSP